MGGGNPNDDLNIGQMFAAVWFHWMVSGRVKNLKVFVLYKFLASHLLTMYSNR